MLRDARGARLGDRNGWRLEVLSWCGRGGLHGIIVVVVDESDVLIVSVVKFLVAGLLRILISTSRQLPILLVY